MHRTTKLQAPCLVSVFAALLIAGTAQAQDDVSSAPQMESSLRQVVVFKDGYGLIVKEATGTTDPEGNIYSDDVPDAAVLGSFWAIPEEGKLNAMVSGWVFDKTNQVVETECAGTIELVEANVGSICSLSIGEDTTLSGRILKVLGPTEERAAPVNHLLEDPTSVQLVGATATTLATSGSKFLLRTTSGDVLVDANSISMLTIENMKTTLTRKVTQKKRSKRLRFEFSEPNKNVKLLVMYFRPGVRWIPTYRLDLASAEAAETTSGSKKTVRLSLQGEIMNEAEDFTDVPIDIVVGVPNFRFKNIPSPLVLESVLRNTLAQAAPQLTNQAFGNNQIMMNNYVSNGGVGNAPVVINANPSAAINLPSELTTKSGNDLFVYNLPRMTLKKGDRATVPILTTDVPYRDVYTWDVTVKHTESIQENQAGTSPLQITENNVWRQIELINNSQIPWTTGAAMIVEGFQPLAQELLTYTPSGQKCRVPVTVAVDVRGRVNDRELSRKLDALRFGGSSYARVTGQINAQVTNNKQQPVDLEMTVRFGGKGEKVSEGGNLTSTHFRNNDWHNYRGDPAVNNSTQATWSTTVKSRTQFTPQVDYHFHTRH